MSGWNGRIGVQRLDPFMNTPSKSSEAARPGPARAATPAPQLPQAAQGSSVEARRRIRSGHGRSQLVMAKKPLIRFLRCVF